MLNPDGVIHGNSRTNAKGYDINRLWQPTKSPQPISTQTHSINKFLQTYFSSQSNSSIQYLLDLHSHSQQFGTFIYSSQHNQTSKLFNYFFQQKCQQVKYEKCKTNMSAQKRTTLRGQFYHRLKVKNSFTIETSFYGYEKVIKDQNIKEKQKMVVPFQLKNYHNIAYGLLYSIQEIYKTKSKIQKTKQVLKIIEEFDIKHKNINIKNKKYLLQYQEEDSNSDCSSQYLEVKQRQQNGLDVHEILINKQKDKKKQRSLKATNNSINHLSKSLNFMSRQNTNKSPFQPKKSSSKQHNDQKNKNRRKRIYSMGTSYRYINSQISDNITQIHIIENCDVLQKISPKLHILKIAGFQTDPSSQFPQQFKLKQ